LASEGGEEVAPETVEKVINSVWIKAGFAGIAILVSIGWAWTERIDCQEARAQICTAQKEHKAELKICRDDTKAIAREAIAAINELKSTLVEIKIYLKDRRYGNFPTSTPTR